MQNKNYCPYCGTKLIKKELINEGIIPYCEKCNEYRFELYSVAVSMIIQAKNTKRYLLIKQYKTNFYRFVAGYINKGEEAEDAVKREMYEEIGVKPILIKPNKTGFYDKSETLMLNYYAQVEDENLNPNYEIDFYKWFDEDEIISNLSSTSLAINFYKYYLKNK